MALHIKSCYLGYNILILLIKQHKITIVEQLFSKKLIANDNETCYNSNIYYNYNKKL